VGEDLSHEEFEAILHFADTIFTENDTNSGHVLRENRHQTSAVSELAESLAAQTQKTGVEMVESPRWSEEDPSVYRGQPYLATIPLELRSQIYIEILNLRGPIDVMQSRKHKPQRRDEDYLLGNLGLACSQFHDEINYFSKTSPFVEDWSEFGMFDVRAAQFEIWYNLGRGTSRQRATLISRGVLTDGPLRWIQQKR
jgi:hypothetical protein